MSSTPTAAAAAAPVKRKRVRKQKTEAEQEQALTIKEEPVATEPVAPAKKKTKREPQPVASFASSTTAKSAAVKTEDEDVHMTDAADEDGATESKEGDGSAKANNGAGYLSQETLNYYKQLAAVLDKDEFENEEDKSMFLSNVVEELCGGDSNKLRATTRRGVAGEAEDADSQSANSPAFVLQRLCSHAKCSHLVQKILEIANAEQVGLFLTALAENVVDVLSDRYGSHVLESILFRLPTLLTAEAISLDDPTTSDELQSASLARSTHAWRNLGTHSEASLSSSGPDVKKTPLRAHFFQLLIRTIPQWNGLAQDSHASFSLRHMIHILAGETNIKGLAESTGSKPGQASPPIVVNFASYLVGLEELLPFLTQEVLQTIPDELEELTRHASAVPVLQSLLRGIDRQARLLGDTGLDSKSAHPTRVQLRTLMAKLLQFTGSDEEQWTLENVSQSTKNSVYILVCDRSGSRLLETICSLGGVNIVSPLFECHMAGRLLELAKHQIANFALQHVLQNVRKSWSSRGRHLLRTAFDELTPHIEVLCSSSRTRVVLELLDACVRVEVKENKMFKLLAGLAQTSFAEPTPTTTNVVGAILLTPIFKSSSSDTTTVSVIGSLIIQSCLQPRRGLQQLSPHEVASDPAASSSSPPFSTVLNAFLQLPREFILQLAMDQTGSHIFDAFVAAPCALNVKQQLLRSFQMKWVDLAMNSSGSFVLEKLFTIAPNQLKIGIAGDLCRVEKRVLASRSGSVVYRKLRLEHYKRHQVSWLTAGAGGKHKAETLFADVLGEDEEKKRTEKKSTTKSATSTKPTAKSPTTATTGEDQDQASKKKSDKPKKEKKTHATTPVAVKEE